MVTMDKVDEPCVLPLITIDPVVAEDNIVQALEGEDTETSMIKTVTFSDTKTKLNPDTIKTVCEVCIKTNESMAIAICKNCKQFLCHVCHQAHKDDTSSNDGQIINKTQCLPPPLSPTVKMPSPTRLAQRKWSVSSTGSTKSDTLERERNQYPQTEFLGQIEVKSISDVERVSVTAVESLPNGVLFLCDSSNKKLKLFRLFGQRHEILSEVCLTSEPGSVAFLQSKTAIVSLPEEKCIQKLRIKERGTLVLQERRRTVFKCFKLVKYHADLVASAQDDINFYIILMQTDGKVLRCIYNEPKPTSRLLQSLTSLALSRNGKTILIVSQRIGCVGMLLTGDIKFRFSEPGEHFHTGLCTGKRGNIYIGCYITDKIVMLNKTGEKLCDFLSFKQMQPEAIHFSDDLKMYVFSGSTKKLFSYGIQY